MYLRKIPWVMYTECRALASPDPGDQQWRWWPRVGKSRELHLFPGHSYMLFLSKA